MNENLVTLERRENDVEFNLKKFSFRVWLQKPHHKYSNSNLIYVATKSREKHFLKIGSPGLVVKGGDS